MKAVANQGKRDARVDIVADPKIGEPADAIVRIISSGIFGAGLHPLRGPKGFKAQFDG